MSVNNQRTVHMILLLLLISPPQAESFIFTAIMTAVSFAYQAYNIINDAHDTYKKFAPQTTLDDVLDQAKRVEEKVDQVGAQLSRQINQAIDTIVTRIDDMNNIRDGLVKLSAGVRRIDNLYRSFELYTKKKIRLNNHTLQDYIQQVTTVGAFAPKDILNDIYDLMIPSSGLRESFLYYIVKNIPEPTGRRYQYYTAVRKGTKGNATGGCQGNKIVIEEKDHCPVCWCTCMEEGYKSKTLRTFSTREQTSDVANNKVVTGVKFVVIENMTHIQIQQGEVLPEGRIVPDSVEWKAIENIKFDQERTNEERQYVYYIDFDNGTKYDMKIPEDFVSFTWERYRICADDLIIPPGYVVTGVKFAPEGDDEQRQPIQLGIQASPYDFDSGKILITDDNPSIWLTPSDMSELPDHKPEYDREKLKISMTDLRNPLTETGTAIPRSQPNSYMVVGSSEIETDAGLTTLPLIDGQEVAGSPPFAAGGIGLYYKSMSEDVGGFIGLRLFGLDPMKNMHIEVLEELDRLKEDVTDFKGCNNEIED